VNEYLAQTEGDVGSSPTRSTTFTFLIHTYNKTLWAQDKLRKHINQIIKEELNTQNEIFGLGKVTMDDVKKKLENMINGMDANGKSKIQTPMSTAYKDSLRDLLNSGKLDNLTKRNQ
jgi:hypothetical protein